MPKMPRTLCAWSLSRTTVIISEWLYNWCSTTIRYRTAAQYTTVHNLTYPGLPVEHPQLGLEAGGRCHLPGRAKAGIHCSVMSGSRIQHHDGKLVCYEILYNSRNLLSYNNLYKYFSILKSPDMAAWQNDYLQGTGCEMYTETLSPSFSGMTFSQASE